MRLIWKVGSFDVDDMILNTLGGLLGFVFYKIVQTIRVRRKRRAGSREKVSYIRKPFARRSFMAIGFFAAALILAVIGVASSVMTAGTRS